MIHINPSSEIARTIEATSLSEIPAIVSKTRSSAKAWRALSVSQRVEILREHSSLVEKHKVDLRDAITSDMGKPLKNSELEVARTVSAAEYLLNHAEEWLAPEPRECGVVHYEPLGLAAAITPWNFPLAIPMFQILPSLLAGNSVVWKPSEYTSEVAQLYFRILSTILPHHVLSIVLGGKEEGRALIEESFDLITFTGSTATGRYIAEKSASNFTRLQLELGGVDAALVLKDVDPRSAAESIVAINAANSGQVCCSIKRVYVEESIFAEFVNHAVGASQSLVVGDPTTSVDMGPLSSQMQIEKCESYLADAVARGAKILSGGSRLPGKGFFFPHTVISDLPSTAKLLHEEAFAPILPILPISEAEDAVEIANSLPYALTASIWGRDEERMKKLAGQLQGGVVGLNRHGVPPVGCPWGGAKHSGIGRARSVEGMRECCNLKFVY
jgi:succinate-semialdehyde dehydrogenase/glutarate-semialdehyde dehydrogenase